MKVLKVYEINDDIPDSIAEGFYIWVRDYNRSAMKFTVEPDMVGDYMYTFMGELTTWLLSQGCKPFEEVIVYYD